MGTEGDNDGAAAINWSRRVRRAEEGDPAAEVLPLIAFFPLLQNP